jgi:hypothetical protein
MTPRRLFLAASLVALAAATSPAVADPLSDAYQGVIANPTDTEVNLQYALVAEGQKKWRLALAAYERILANDPDNARAKAGLQRIRRIIQPAQTQKTVEVGTEYDSNALHEPGSGDDWTFYAKGRVRDERNWMGMRWRTTATAYADTHAVNHDLDYMVAMFDIGPILDLNGTMMAGRPFVGAAVSGLGGSYYYSDVNFGGSIEGYLDGAYQWARVKAGYRSFGDDISTTGWYAEAVAHWAHKDIFSDHDLIFVEPWFRWSGIDGGGFDSFANPVTPGRYVGGGARFEYDTQVSRWLTVGASFRLSERDYDVGGRRDFLIAPGASLMFTNLLSPQTDIRVEYEFQHNNSNQDENDYDNHAVTISLVARR